MYTKNEEDLQSLGERLGCLLEKNDVLILTGELGAGKTTFTKGLAKGLQISQMIKSPTYTIVREYEGRLPLYHLDVYRIEGDADSIDLDEFLFGGGVTVIEWGNLLGDALPDRSQITFPSKGFTCRKTFRGASTWSMNCSLEKQNLVMLLS